jgi:hypothetical protein
MYVPFLICGLALPISPFFPGILDFYNLNLTHLNPNSILQILSLYICVWPTSEFFLISDYGSICITVGLGWLGGSTSSWVVQVWRCAAGGRQNTLTFLSRTTLKGGTLSGLLWKNMASPSPSVWETAKCTHSELG